MTDLWTQPDLFGTESVTEVIVRVGTVGNHHAQWQIEARDEGGELVAMSARHHLDLRDLERELGDVLTEARLIIHARHPPFP